MLNDLNSLWKTTIPCGLTPKSISLPPLPPYVPLPFASLRSSPLCLLMLLSPLPHVPLPSASLCSSSLCLHMCSLSLLPPYVGTPTLGCPYRDQVAQWYLLPRPCEAWGHSGLLLLVWKRYHPHCCHWYNTLLILFCSVCNQLWVTVAFSIVKIIWYSRHFVSCTATTWDYRNEALEWE